MAGTFFLELVWTRELVRLKTLRISYMRYFFIDIAPLEKILQCNEIQVRPLFRQTVELKQMKICNFKNQNSTEKMKKKFI